jgi:hypothetical protein
MAARSPVTPPCCVLWPPSVGLASSNQEADMTHSVTGPRARVVIATLALAALMAHVATVPALAGPAGAQHSVADATALADTIAPTTPENLHLVSRTKSGSITLGWVASSDDVGVAGYRMYRDGRWSGTLYQAGVDLLGTVWYDKLGGRIRTAVTYHLYAFDAAGNVSAPATLVVTP